MLSVKFQGRKEKMSDYGKKVKTLSKIGKIISLVLMIIAAVLVVVFVVGLIVLVLTQGVTIKGGLVRYWARLWSGRILGVEQPFSTVCGLCLGFGILFLGMFFMCFLAFRFFRKVLITGNPADAKCKKALKALGFATIFIPTVSLVLDYVGLLAEHAVFPETVLNYNGNLGLVAGLIFGAYIALNLAVGVGAFIFAGLNGAFAENKAVVAEPAPAVEVVPAESVEEEVAEEAAEEIEEEVAAGEDGKKTSVGFDRSFTGKLIQAKDETKEYYSAIKNAILSYKGKGKHVSDRISWKYETFNIGRNKVVKMKVRGKTLCVYLALDPKTYTGTKYKVEDVSDSKSDEGTPLMYRINNARRAKYVLALIAATMENYAFAINENATTEDYTKGLKYKNDAKLVKEGLAKKVVVSRFPKL